MSTDSKNHHIAITIAALGSQPVHHIDLAVTAVAVQDVRETITPGSRVIKPEYFGAIKDGDPIFTQAMSDAGELPPIGCECLANIEGDWLKCEVFSHHKDVAHVYLFGENTFGFCRDMADFKPLDSRTDEDKAIDDLHQARSVDDCTYCEIVELIKADKITGVKWTGK